MNETSAATVSPFDSPNKEVRKMPVVRLQQKSYQLEDRIMEGYAMAYHAYLARRDLPGPQPTFADFVEIRKLQAEIEELSSENFLAA
jgi:hypothetical protein